MRTATVRLSPSGGDRHFADHDLVSDPDLNPEAIDHVRGLADGTGVILFRVRGGDDRVSDLLEATPDVLEYHVTGGNGTVHAYVHFRPPEVVSSLFYLQRTNAVVVRTPIRWLEDGKLEVSMVGSHDTLQAVIEEIPEEVETELLEIGEYAPGDDSPDRLLTDRQREVLDAALEVGYYDEPREATQADVADRVGLSAATVGEHLRRIEGTVFREMRR